MARWRRYAPAIRSSPEYRGLSRPAPNAQSLYDFLVIGPMTLIIPGLVVAGPASIFEALGWDDEDPVVLGRVWAELLASGLVRFDKQARLLWLPQITTDLYLPDQPQVLQSWSAPWAELPDCDLKHEAWVALREAFAARQPRNRARREVKQDAAATAFEDTFLRCCPEPRCARQQALCEAHNETGNQAYNEPGNQDRKEPDEAPKQTSSQPGSQPGRRSSSRSVSLQDQDQDQKQKEKTQSAPPVTPAPAPMRSTVPDVYRQLYLLWSQAPSVLHVQWVPSSPAPHEGLPGRMDPATERYWLDLMRTLQPSDDDLVKAGKYLAARQHWQDRQSRTGVSLTFLVKPSAGNLFDLIAKAKAWQPGSAQPAQVGAHRGHVAPSASADQGVSIEELASLHAQGGTHGQR